MAFAIAACGGTEHEAGEEASESSAETAEDPAAEEETGAEEQARPFLPVSMQRSTRVETFPHDAHVRIDCRECHEAPVGHGVHSDLVCAECHRSSAMATRSNLTPADCMACHHGADQTRSCGACHQAVGPRVVTRSIEMEVWSSARTRELPFDHEDHESRTCETCHVEPTTLEPSRSCGSCHEDHHREEARCMTCHAQPPPSAHDLEAHLGCTGSGCHTSPAVEALAQTRSGCLVCHQDQEDHQPGQDCAECHQVRPRGSRSLEAGVPSPYLHGSAKVEHR